MEAGFSGPCQFSDLSRGVNHASEDLLLSMGLAATDYGQAINSRRSSSPISESSTPEKGVGEIIHDQMDGHLSILYLFFASA